MAQDQKPLFVIDPNPTVDWPVIVKLPADGGTFAEFQFTAKIRVLSAKDYDALSPAKAEPVAVGDVADMVPAPVKTMGELLADNAAQFAQLVVGWDGVVDTSGAPVPFTQEALAAQVTGPHGVELSAGLWLAIAEIRSGARLGNSAPLPAAG